MSEHVKVTPDKLKVSDDALPGEEAISSTGEEAISSTILRETVEPSLQPDLTQQTSLPPTSIGNSSETGSTDTDSTVPGSQLDETTPGADEQNWLRPATKQNQRPKDNSLTRHRAIVLGCASTSLAVLALSLMNLMPLIETPAKIDEKLNITEIKRPELPHNLVYGNTNLDRLLDPNELIEVREATWQGTRSGFIDQSGKLVVPPQFADVKTFKDGLVAFRALGKDGLWGYADTTGRIVIEPNFDEAYSFSNGCAYVVQKSITKLIDKKGNPIVSDIERIERAFDFGLFLAHSKSNHNLGLADGSGKWLLPPEYDGIVPFEPTPYERYIPGVSVMADPTIVFKIKQGPLWGVADRTGKVLIPPKFTEIADYNDGHVMFKENGKYGIGNSKGVVVKPEYYELTQFNKLMVGQKNDLKWYFIDAFGKQLNVPPVEGIVTTPGTKEWFVNGLGPVLKDNLVGYVNAQGQFVIAPQFTYGYPFSQKFATVFQDGFWRFIDTAGNIMPFKFGGAPFFKNGLAMVTLPGPLFPFVHAASNKRMTDAMDSTKENQRPKKDEVSSDSK